MSEITVKELTTQEETARFWEKLHAYFRRDLFPQGEPGREQALDYFLGEEYRAVMEKHRTRPVDPLYFLAFARDGEGETTVAAVNAGPEAVRLDLPWSAPLAVDALTEQRFLASDGVVRLTLPPRDAVLLI